MSTHYFKSCDLLKEIRRSEIRIFHVSTLLYKLRHVFSTNLKDISTLILPFSNSSIIKPRIFCIPALLNPLLQTNCGSNKLVIKLFQKYCSTYKILATTFNIKNNFVRNKYLNHIKYS